MAGASKRLGNWRKASFLLRQGWRFCRTGPHFPIVHFVVKFILYIGIVLGLLGCAEVESSGPATSEEPRIVFTDVTGEAGLDDFRHVTGAFGEKWMPETMGSGVGVIDYNGDDLPDLLVVGGGTWPGRGEPVQALRLYRNNGDLTFADVTTETGLGDLQAYGFGLTVADFDDDGRQDFYLTTLAENLLFRNDGGTFSEVGREAGVAGPSEWNTCSIFFDANRDGHLDLYVCGYVEWSPELDVTCRIGRTKAYCPPEQFTGLPGRFYRNRGDGTFLEHTQEAGFLPFGGKSLGVVEIDLMRDGWPDLIVANDSERNLLYVNNGDGTFSERAIVSGVAFDNEGRPRGGMGIDAGDVDGTGRTTVFIGNFSNQMIGVFEEAGGRLFRDRAAASRIGHPSFLTLTFGLFLFDPDLDGRLELFVANGHIQERIGEEHQNVTYRQAPQVFQLREDGTFEEISRDLGGVFTKPLVARGAAHVDIDLDGDQDIVVAENKGSVHLWRNDSSGGGFLRVRLEGSASNRGGIGARVVALVGDRRLERRIQTGGSYLSTSERTATFGLGDAATVDSLYVYWPSGREDRYGELAANRHLCIQEGAAVARECAAPPS